MYENFIYEVIDLIVMIIFNWLECLNVFIGLLFEEFVWVIGEVEKDLVVVVILFIGVGCGFCVGVDMDGLKSIVDFDGGLVIC